MFVGFVTHIRYAITRNLRATVPSFMKYEMSKLEKVKDTLIPDICHERHEYIHANFFWPV